MWEDPSLLTWTLRADQAYVLSAAEKGLKVPSHEFEAVRARLNRPQLVLILPGIFSF